MDSGIKIPILLLLGMLYLTIATFIGTYVIIETLIKVMIKCLA